MAGQKTISVTYTPPPPPPPIADYHVVGTITPDSRGNYFAAGFNDGQPYYRRDDSHYFVWYSTFATSWYISTNVGQYVNPRWRSPLVDIEGVYYPEAGSSGNATVVLGPA